jgi:hypothetical protein
LRLPIVITDYIDISEEELKNLPVEELASVAYEAIQGNKNYCLSFLEFYLSDVNKNTILFIEPNNWHGEVMPSYAKYLLDRGYSLDVLMTPKLAAMEPMCCIQDKRIILHTVSFEWLSILFNNRDKMNKYKALFFTSNVIYKSLSKNSYL